MQTLKWAFNYNGLIGYASRAFQLGTFARIDAVSTYLYVSFAAAVAADSTVAISLCALLFHSRTGIKKTDSILRILMAFSINTGLLTRYVSRSAKNTQGLDLTVRQCQTALPHWPA